MHLLAGVDTLAALKTGNKYRTPYLLRFLDPTKSVLNSNSSPPFMLANITGHLSSFDHLITSENATCMEMIGGQLEVAANSVFDFEHAPKFEFKIIFGIIIIHLKFFFLEIDG